MQYPEELFKQGVSDHAPLCITFGSRPQKAVEDQAAPRFLCRAPGYKQYLNPLLRQSDLMKLPTIAKWAEYKRLLREAARLTRDKLVSARTPPLEAKMIMFRSISRAVHFNLVNLARTLLATTTVASEFSEISDDYIVSLSWPMNFWRQYEQLQRDLVEGR
eukprot:4569174-Pyramimonas_sp.AAC.1